MGTAEDRWRQALTLGQELGIRPLVARCHVGLAALAWRTGKGAEASEHRTTAATLLREMGMTYWLGRLEAELTTT